MSSLPDVASWQDRAKSSTINVNTSKPAEKRAARNGGIDLTQANMNLQTQNTGEGIKFQLDPAMLAKLQNAPGFVPVIINIQPLKNLQEFLGLNQPSHVSEG